MYCACAIVSEKPRQTNTNNGNPRNCCNWTAEVLAPAARRALKSAALNNTQAEVSQSPSSLASLAANLSAALTASQAAAMATSLAATLDASLLGTCWLIEGAAAKVCATIHASSVVTQSVPGWPSTKKVVPAQFPRL